MSGGINSAINNALSGLEAFEMGISTVSNNIANQSTDGYSSESVSIQTAYAGSGQEGQGVEPGQIVRAASGFAAAQLRTANTANSAASQQSTSLTAIADALANNGNIQTTISQFFSDVGSLAGNPSSTALRQTVLSDAQSVTSSFQSATSNIATVMAGAQQNLSSGVTAANNLLAQLSDINKSMQQNPNSPSLEDEQQAALNSLSQYLPVNTITQSNGSVVVASGGTVLLDQGGAQDLAISTDSKGKQTITAGVSKALVTLLESDGSLGGSLGTLSAGNQAQQSLNAVASTFANQVNQSQAEGLDANGNAGENLFSVPSPTVTPNTANTGSAQLAASITNTGALPSDGGPFSLTYSSTSSSTSGWNAVDQATGQTYPVTQTTNNGSTNLNFAGMTLALSGTAQNGDSFTVNPAPNAASGLAVTAISTSALAASDPYVAAVGSLTNGSVVNNNAGTITAGTDSVVSQPASNAAVVPSNDFGQNLQVTFTSSTAYTISVAGSQTTIASGTLTNGSGTIAVQYPTTGQAAGKYWQLPISGSPQTGDTLTLEPGGQSSGSNAQRMSSLWTAQNTTSSGSLEQGVIGLATGLGSNASAAQQLATATSAQVTTATSNLATVAGVNSDQQAVLLTNYQQAYQAAAQIITAARSMFQSLISAV